MLEKYLLYAGCGIAAAALVTIAIALCVIAKRLGQPTISPTPPVVQQQVDVQAVVREVLATVVPVVIRDVTGASLQGTWRALREAGVVGGRFTASSPMDAAQPPAPPPAPVASPTGASGFSTRVPGALLHTGGAAAAPPGSWNGFAAARQPEEPDTGGAGLYRSTAADPTERLPAGGEPA